MPWLACTLHGTPPFAEMCPLFHLSQFLGAVHRLSRVFCPRFFPWHDQCMRHPRKTWMSPIFPHKLGRRKTGITSRLSPVFHRFSVTGFPSPVFPVTGLLSPVLLLFKKLLEPFEILDDGSFAVGKSVVIAVLEPGRGPKRKTTVVINPALPMA